jgi:hypothetical protein
MNRTVALLLLLLVVTNGAWMIVGLKTLSYQVGS